MADDRIFLGEGLFETIKIINHRPCYAELHWQRMSSAASKLQISYEQSYEAWYELLLQCIGCAKLQTGGIRVILTSGRATRGLCVQGDHPSLLLEPFVYQSMCQALNLVTAPWLRDANNPVYQLKTVNYLESILARRHALSMNADDALFFNMQHHITETTVANLFVIHQNKLYTPPITCGVLPGIIRNRLLSLCLKHTIECQEEVLQKEWIINADAVFVTNVLQGIRPVRSLDGVLLNLEHPLLNQLQDLLKEDEELSIALKLSNSK